MRLARHELATPWAAAGIVLLVGLIFVCARLMLFTQWLPNATLTQRVSVFAIVTQGNADIHQTPPSLFVLPGKQDYDGEYFYRLSLAPFTTQQTADGILLDNPAYRQQRIVYPLLAWALSGGGNPYFLPWVMVGINLLSLAALAGVTGTFARQTGHSVLWGSAMALLPGFALSLSVDTPEPLALCLLISTLLLARQRQFGWATLCGTLAVLTRETALFTAFAALGLWVWARVRGGRPALRDDNPPAFFWLVPMCVYVLWRLIQATVWGRQGLRLHNINLPGIALIRFVHLIVRSWTPVHGLWAVEILFLAVLGVATLTALKSSQATPLEKGTWLLFAGLTTLLSRAVWNVDSAFLRVLFEFSGLAFLILMQSPVRLRLPLAYVSVMLWLAVAAHLLTTGIPLRQPIFESCRSRAAQPSVVTLL